MPHQSAALQLGGAGGRVAFLLAFCALALAAIALQFAKVRALYGGDASDERRVNCPSCGARTAVDEEVCEYCGEPLDGGAE
ncbi:zinc ribbon domain-containing protein [Haloplanus aerogenes]|uniref:Zinc ribbon protein n=1 Tax=Haloplanus aerogenes TaxID=660522 RepID=A0A3M0DRR9_9EURY|nr:zinc ribbon domain-containing protein [Haloplanus aerogenes]AZH24173.1 hypothetical protein DU502_01735 [Haloplanus aerogenes]RMB24207.1 zinc ribbon protein [Haloplanus aerogenes]